jgi:hypothetical protein
MRRPRGIGVYQLNFPDALDFRSLADGNPHVFGADDRDTARVNRGHTNQRATIVGDDCVSVHVAIGECQREHPAMLTPPDRAGRRRSIGSERAVGDIKSPIAAQPRVDALERASTGLEDKGSCERKD